RRDVSILQRRLDRVLQLVEAEIREVEHARELGSQIAAQLDQLSAAAARQIDENGGWGGTGEPRLPAGLGEPVRRLARGGVQHADQRRTERKAQLSLGTKIAADPRQAGTAGKIRRTAGEIPQHAEAQLLLREKIDVGSALHDQRLVLIDGNLAERRRSGDRSGRTDQILVIRPLY